MSFKYPCLKDLSASNRRVLEPKRRCTIKRFPEALEIIKTLEPDADDDRLQFWRGWCLTSMDQVVEASAALLALEEAHPESPWAKTAKQLRDAIVDRNALVDASNETAGRVIDHFRKGILAFEATVKATNDDGKTYTVYLGIMPRKEFIDLVVSVGKKNTFAYRATEDRTSVWIDGEPNVYVLEAGGFVPIPVATIEESENGELSFRFEAQMGSSVSNLADANKALFNSPFLTTPAGRKRILRKHLSAGSVPLKVETKNGFTTVEWLVPNALEPEPGVNRFIVDGEGQLIRVEFSESEVELRYSADQAFKFNSPDWPDKPKILLTDPTQMFPVLGRGITETCV